jgi:hypothetical protein
MNHHLNKFHHSIQKKQQEDNHNHFCYDNLTDSGMNSPPSFEIIDFRVVLVDERFFCGAIVPGGGDSVPSPSSSSTCCPSSDIEPESS